MKEYLSLTFKIELKKKDYQLVINADFLKRLLPCVKGLTFSSTLNHYYDRFTELELDKNKGLHNILEIIKSGLYSISDRKNTPNYILEIFIDATFMNISVLGNVNGQDLNFKIKEFTQFANDLHCEFYEDSDLSPTYTPIMIHSEKLKSPLPPRYSFGHIASLVLTKNDISINRNFPNAYNLIKNADLPRGFELTKRKYGLILSLIISNKTKEETFKNIEKAELWISQILNCKIHEDYNEVGDKKLLQRSQIYNDDFVGRDDNGRYHYYFTLEFDSKGSYNKNKWDNIVDFTKTKVIPEHNHITFDFVNVVVHKRENAFLIAEKIEGIDIERVYYVEDEKMLTKEYSEKELWEINPPGNWLTKEEENQLLNELKE